MVQDGAVPDEGDVDSGDVTDVVTGVVEEDHPEPAGPPQELVFEESRFRRVLGAPGRAVARFGGPVAAVCWAVAAIVYFLVFSDIAGWWAPDEPPRADERVLVDWFTVGITAAVALGVCLGLGWALARRKPVTVLVWAVLSALMVVGLLRSNLDIASAQQQLFPVHLPHLRLPFHFHGPTSHPAPVHHEDPTAYRPPPVKCYSGSNNCGGGG